MQIETQYIQFFSEYFYTFVALFLLSLVFLIHNYSLRQEKKKLKKMIDRRVAVFEKAFDISEDAILILSNDNKVVYANRSMEKLLNLNGEYQNKTLQTVPLIKNTDTLLPLDQFIDQEYQRKNDQMHIYPQASLVCEDVKQEIPINLYLDRTKRHRKDETWNKIVSIHDLRNTIKQRTSTLRHQLTGLPNQEQLVSDLNELFSKKHLDESKLALILIDIDNFSMLRSIIGHEQANKILIRFAEYLYNFEQGSSLDISVYHTHHNNFLLTVTKVGDIDQIYDMIQTIQGHLKRFYTMEDVRLYLTASIGVAIYPDSGTRRVLIDRAYQALASAQKKGYGQYEIYYPESIRKDYDELLLYNEMHEALKKNEFEVYYQAIADRETEEIIAAEALVRWNHPKYGVIPPNVFIPIMEKTGFIIELGQFVTDEVLKQLKRWELFQFRQIPVSINVTLIELEHKGFAESISKKLQLHQVSPELLKFEITEGYAMLSEKQTQQEIRDLKKLGVSIALDDFGTGYTSFMYLKKFPADYLKVDKSLIKYILTNQEDQRIVKAIIDLGHQIGMKVIIEGIENKRMFTLLSEYGADHLQGYYISRPLPVYEFQKLLR